jgi:hypothetical protein
MDNIIQMHLKHLILGIYYCPPIVRDRWSSGEEICDRYQACGLGLPRFMVDVYSTFQRGYRLAKPTPRSPGSNFSAPVKTLALGDPAQGALSGRIPFRKRNIGILTAWLKIRRDSAQDLPFQVAVSSAASSAAPAVSNGRVIWLMNAQACM